jgi:prolyl-tRNA synthetase
MGGSRSEEFLHPTDVGEDTFVRTDGGYAANVEAYRVTPPPPLPLGDQPAAVIFDSPNTPTIETLVALANDRHPRPEGAWTAADTLKNVVLGLTYPDGSAELVIVGVPGDRDVDMKRAEAFFGPATVEAADDADFARHKSLVKGYIGPWSAQGAVLGEKSSSGIRFLVDPRVVQGTSWVTGANEHEKHVFNLVCGRDFLPDGTADIATVREGDEAPDGSGPLKAARGMEIGHVFQLGRKYADALGLQVLDENGSLVTVTMGSYGIGVTRLVAVLAEANHDDKGLIWPEVIAPFDVHLVAAGKDDVVFEVARALVSTLEASGKEVLYDDRPKLSPGVKFADAEILGVPHIVIVGRGAPEGIVEYWNRRTGERTEIPLDAVLSHLPG